MKERDKPVTKAGIETFTIGEMLDVCFGKKWFDAIPLCDGRNDNNVFQVAASFRS